MDWNAILQKVVLGGLFMFYQSEKIVKKIMYSLLWIFILIPREMHAWWYFYV